MALSSDVFSKPRFRFAFCLALLFISLFILLPGVDHIAIARKYLSQHLTEFHAPTNQSEEIVNNDTTQVPTENQFVCAQRFGVDYLQHFSKTATEYCDANSTARLTCFNHHILP